MDRARRRRARLTCAVAALVVGGSLAACAGERPSLTVEHVDGPFDPLVISASGLPDGEVRLEAVADLPQGTLVSSATFEVSDGTLDLTTDAPVAGDWQRADPMAPFRYLTPDDGASPYPGSEGLEVALTLYDGDEALVSRTVDRPGFAEDVVVAPVRKGRIHGVYARPTSLPAGGPPRPAVLAFGGSEGGLASGASVAEAVAAMGYPALGIAYFDSGDGTEDLPDHLPDGLVEVPVEIFLEGLAWLRGQPGVDGDRVFTFGVSRGGEMALWLAAERGDLVHGAIAPVSSGELHCGLGVGGRRSAWSRNGLPLPFACGLWERSPDFRDGPAVIDVGSIDGPVVVACGGRDSLWDSCAKLDRVVDRRRAAGRAGDTSAVVEERASHHVTGHPYLWDPWISDLTPETVAATYDARASFWVSVQDVLESAARD